MTKMLIPLGSITGDPIGAKRYMVIDDQNLCTGACETILVGADGKEIEDKL